MSRKAALLLLADGRFPAGGYAHSGGLESSIRHGRVGDVDSLASFLEGRASTVGLVCGAFSAAACDAVRRGRPAQLASLDIELDARMPSPAQRSTSRQLGRQLVRAMRMIASDPLSEHLGPRAHQSLAVGAACAVMGLEAHDAALVALHESVAGPTAAAVRLLSLDPLATHRVLACLGPLLDDLADDAVEASRGPACDLPAAAAPLLDIAAERHACLDARLFAS